MKYEEVKSTSKGFYPIYRFMEQELELRGSELRAYALIFSFSVSKTGMYYGSRKYLADTLSVSERTVYRILNALFKRGLIENVWDRVSDKHGVRCAHINWKNRESSGNESFVERCKNKALDNYVKREYGELSDEDFEVVRAAAEDKFERMAKEKELDERVKRVMKMCREQNKKQTANSQSAVKENRL